MLDKQIKHCWSMHAGLVVPRHYKDFLKNVIGGPTDTNSKSDHVVRVSPASDYVQVIDLGMAAPITNRARGTFALRVWLCAPFPLPFDDLMPP